MILHWRFDPILFQLGPLAVRWYGLLFVGGFYAGLMMIQRIFRAEGRDPVQAERLFMYALLGTVVGARLAHCLFYEPAYYLAHPLAILRIWEGGLASHGGVAGLVLGVWWGWRRLDPRPPFLWLLDRVAIPGAFVAICIRVANFLNSEIVGLPTSGGWGVVFESVDAVPRHPAQLYEAAAYLLIFGILVALYRRFGRGTPHGLLTGVLLALVFAARIAVEFVKTPQAAYEAGQAFTVGQWLSVPFVLLGVAIAVRALRAPRPATETAAAAGPP